MPAPSKLCSLLCAACAKKFSHSSLGNRCDRCPNPGDNRAIGIVGVLCGILGLIGYIHITLSDGGHVDQSDGAKSILLSYIQSISLLATFPIAWPDIFVTIFKIGGAVPGKKTFLCCVRFNVQCKVVADCLLFVICFVFFFKFLGNILSI